MRKVNPVNKNGYMVNAWKKVPIPGYERYLVSTRGEVMSLDGIKLLSQDKMHTGYYCVYLCKDDGKKGHFRVHRLIAITFIPIPAKYRKLGLGYDDLIVNHLDGDKTNNRIDNLEWTTVRGNTIHARDTGLLGYMGENSHLAKMDNKTAEKCCKMLAKGKSYDEIVNKLGISKKSVIHIKSGECWTHISKKYKFPTVGTSIPNSIDISVIHNVCKTLDEGGMTDSQIAEKTGISRRYVSDIRNRKRQRKISDNYNFWRNNENDKVY